MRTIRVFDSTLRDGEQSPGFSMTIKEKLKIAQQLEALGVDVIEAGFAVASPGDFSSVRAVAREIKTSYVASLARLIRSDIDYAYNAVRDCAKPMLHVFIATSDIHLRDKLHTTREEVLNQIDELVAYAKSLIPYVEFSAEDATRSDIEFLKEVYVHAVRAGADIINIPDTVGYATPEEMARIVTEVRSVPELADIVISVHCHNDLGLAVSNSLSAIKAGADQVECTVNGIGERAGNAALEEIVMNLKVRREYYGADTAIDTTGIIRTSKLLTMLTGVKVQPNKAITGENAFAHEAGIHQHGVMCNRETYEIIDPSSIGLSENRIVLGKHSGRHAFEEKLRSLGYTVEAKQLDELFTQFKILADRKKVVIDKDIEALLKNTVLEIPQTYTLDKYVINSSNVLSSTCSISVVKDGNVYEGYAMAVSGPIEAAFNAINNATGCDITLTDYSIEAVTGGTDAQGAVSVQIRYNERSFKGYGVDQNIFEASIKAYINAINNMFYNLSHKEEV